MRRLFALNCVCVLAGRQALRRPYPCSTQTYLQSDIRFRRYRAPCYGKCETPVHTRSKRPAVAKNSCACGRFDLPTAKRCFHSYCRKDGLAAVLRPTIWRLPSRPRIYRQLCFYALFRKALRQKQRPLSSFAEETLSIFKTRALLRFMMCFFASLCTVHCKL